MIKKGLSNEQFIKAFELYIEQNELFEKNDPILLAISGGKDSVVLAHILHKTGYKFAFAHCNFKLRPASDSDEHFTKQLAERYKVSFFSTHFDTQTYAQIEKVSIQMAARELRYEWLEEIRQKHHFSYIATAHHLNDSIETVLYNLSKGTGIRGLHGILPKKKYLIRPLLFADRLSIDHFYTKEGLVHVEDESNSSDKYARNFIRHQIIPSFEKLNSNFVHNMRDSIQYFNETENILDLALEQYKSELVSYSNDEIAIHYKLLPNKIAPTLLFEFVREYGFNSDQVKMILGKGHQAGVYFNSSTHKLLVDREHLIVKPIELVSKVEEVFIKQEDQKISFLDKILNINILNQVPETFPNDPEIAFLDASELNYPLTLRLWKPGDIFQPFGMKGKHQKVQDFLTHQKLSRFQKEKIFILESNEVICWIVGWRIDERFKVTSNTKQVLKISLK